MIRPAVSLRAPLVRLVTFAALVAFAALGGSCSQPPAPGDGPSPGANAAPAREASQEAGAPAAGAAPPEERPKLSAESFADGAKAFDAARRALLTRYVDPTLTEDRLYAAAVRGMLEYADPKMTKWNALLSPSELAAIQSDLHGELVGIGVKFEFKPETGYADVLAVVPRSPADRAGVVAGDRVVTVDGVFYKGKTAADVTAAIRGKAGETVTLAILREDKMITVPIQRAAFGFDPVASMALPDGVALVRIASFSDTTAAAFRAALDAASAQHARALVLDLRHDPGGLFDAATACAEALSPPGSVVVYTKRRDGKEEPEVTKGAQLLAGLPTAILVDEQTASGAELVTAALRASRHASVVGAHTFGKWSVQKIEELGNGFAMKYTMSVFEAPDHTTYEGTGLAPDVEVSMDAKQVEKALSITDPAKRVAADAQLRTAIALLKARLEGR